MLSFCGQDRILIDANGRFKLPPRLIEDFLSGGTGDVVFHCLVEGALAIYPEKVYAEMRKRTAEDMQQAAMSMLKRRQLRQFGAWSTPGRITQQGRLTVPQEFRQATALAAGSEAMLIGVEVGVEVWNIQRWQAEQQLILEHEISRGDLELNKDLDFQQ